MLRKNAVRQHGLPNWQVDGELLDQKLYAQPRTHLLIERGCSNRLGVHYGFPVRQTATRA